MLFHSNQLYKQLNKSQLVREIDLFALHPFCVSCSLDYFKQYLESKHRLPIPQFSSSHSTKSVYTLFRLRGFAPELTMVWTKKLSSFFYFSNIIITNKLNISNFKFFFILLVYVNVGAAATDTATVTMTWGNIVTAKQYNIFVQQIECSSKNKYAGFKICEHINQSIIF